MPPLCMASLLSVKCYTISVYHRLLIDRNQFRSNEYFLLTHFHSKSIKLSVINKFRPMNAVFPKIFCIFATLSLSHAFDGDQQNVIYQNVKEMFQGCRKQLTEWVGFNQQSNVLLENCQIFDESQKILSMYEAFVDVGLNMNLNHIDVIRQYMKKYPELKEALTCLIDQRDTENEYFNEQRRYKYFARFVRQYPSQGKFLFVEQTGNYFNKGKKICNYFKAFFEYYYLNILRPSETTSTTFLRALTVRSDIFKHQDIAYCVNIDTHGTIVEQLDNLDINNIYIKVPDLVKAIRFMKLKKECKDEEHLAIVRGVRERLEGIDIFKVMYNEHEPFVEIAAEKFGTTQIKLLARKLAHILQNPEQYRRYSMGEL